MNCMKCGTDVPDGRVFCDSCLRGMADYPVKPGTVVLLPKRPEQPSVKIPYIKRRTPPSLEEQVVSLRKRLRIMTVLFLLTLVAAAFLAYFSVEHLLEQDAPLPGQNYSAMTTSESSSDTEPVKADLLKPTEAK